MLESVNVETTTQANFKTILLASEYFIVLHKIMLEDYSTFDIVKSTYMYLYVTRDPGIR